MKWHWQNMLIVDVTKEGGSLYDKKKKYVVGTIISTKKLFKF